MSETTKPGPRPPHRPGRPVLDPGAAPVPPLLAGEGLEPFRYRRVALTPPGGDAGEELAGERILVLSIHDGDKIPADLLDPGDRVRLEHPQVHRCYRRERDWGANLVAGHLARHLGLGGYLRVELARAFLDHGRLPGDSPAGAPHLLRKSIFSPVSGLISRGAKDRVLERFYDRFDRAVTRRLENKLLSVAVHTYDPLDEGGTERPEVSLISGQGCERWRSVLPAPAGDPLLPAQLLENACDHALTREAMRSLERCGRRVALNRPYDLHPGSVEWRTQVRLFFRYLERRFAEALPATARQVPYRRVWRMLGDVTRRSATSRALHGYLHRSLPAPAGREWCFAEARQAYREVERFLAGHQAELLRGYRFAHERTSSLALEVRKDLLCELDREGSVAGLKVDAEQTAREIARALAAAVAAWVRRELPALDSAPGEPQLSDRRA